MAAVWIVRGIGMGRVIRTCREGPIPVMGKTGTTSEFRDALFVGSTYGAQGITVAVRIGFDDNRTLGRPGPRRPRPSPSIGSVRWMATEQSISDPLAGRLQWDGERDP